MSEQSAQFIGANMALIKCKECGNKISKEAEICPQCGAPRKKSGKLAVLGGLLALLGLFILGVVVFISRS